MNKTNEPLYCTRCGKKAGSSYAIWAGGIYHHKCIKNEILERHPEWLEFQSTHPQGVRPVDSPVVELRR